MPKFVVVWIDEFGKRDWAKADSKKEVEEIKKEISRFGGVAIRHTAEVTGTMYCPSLYNKAKKTVLNSNVLSLGWEFDGFGGT